MTGESTEHGLDQEPFVLGPPAPSRVTVLFDESTAPLRMVAAAVFGSSYAEVEEKIEELFGRMEESYYLDALKSYERHRRNAFHACEDPQEAYAFFIDLLAGIMPIRIYILFTDGTRRPDLGETQTLVVLYRELIRTVLQSVRSVDEVNLIFETHQSLNRKFDEIVVSAARTVSGRFALATRIGQKRKPHALAVADYAMHIFNQWLSAGCPTDPQRYQYRNWRAIRRSVSLVRSLEEGTIIRRGLP